ncbi:Hypothetical predicted protein [Olea europaea subsp. europaea]|uniref:Co-chaperone protein p23 n=1 Tax=Olea europaea subsp. europaea TaxID=158383 RepID=A0A8S0QRI3_OLEEU|nr:Hypothetical predicted protein [Olea europaea subsp. europaea]
MSRHPEAEREDLVYLTVLLPDAINPKVNLDPEGVFTFSATAGTDNSLYELNLKLHDKVNVEESKINIGVRHIFCVLEKAEKKWWTKLLWGDEKVPHYVKVDWDKWVDADDEAGPADFDMGGMDFSKFGDMGGLRDDAMGDDLEDSDDEELEAEKSEEKTADEREGEASSLKTESTQSA